MQEPKWEAMAVCVSSGLGRWWELVRFVIDFRVCPNRVWVRQDGNWELPHSSYLIRRRQWQPTPVLLPGKSHGWRSLEGYSPWDLWGSDTAEQLHFHFSLSCIGEGNGNSLQRSCLENPRAGGAWWAAVYGVAQSRTRLKRLSSSSSSNYLIKVC